MPRPEACGRDTGGIDGMAVIPIVTPTHFRYAKYCDLLLALLDCTWPGHPPVWFITDGGRIKHANTIRINSDSWVKMLYQGLLRLKKIYPGLRYVYLIPEDLYPLWRCSQRSILKVQELALKKKLPCVSFVVKGEYRGNRRVRFGKVALRDIAEDYYWYSRNQPSLWDLRHLIETCEYGLKNNISTCWQFESIKTKGHYVSYYPWPNIKDGLFQIGWVNLKAVKKIKTPPAPELKNMLFKLYIKQQFGNGFARRKSRAELVGTINLLKAVADPNRFRILKILQARPTCACVIAKILGLSREKVLKQLDILAGLNLVQVWPKNNPQYYLYITAYARDYYKFSPNLLPIIRKWENWKPLIRRDKLRVRTIERKKICRCRVRKTAKAWKII